MAKLLKYGFVSCLIIASLLMSVTYAENYISKEFPSDQILINNIITYELFEKAEIRKMLGKYQDKDGAYHVYFIYETRPFGRLPKSTGIGSLKLAKLDTNVWILLDPGKHAGGILQIGGIQVVPTLGNEHIASVETPHIPYNTRPPTSGPHLPSLARWGIHTKPIPDELQVHNLEDGGVLVQYNCRDCDELIGNLQAIVSRYSDRVILAPYPQMDARIALTAWGRIDTFDEVDERRIVRFIDAYRGIDHHPRQ